MDDFCTCGCRGGNRGCVVGPISVWMSLEFRGQIITAVFCIFRKLFNVNQLFSLLWLWHHQWDLWVMREPSRPQICIMVLGSLLDCKPTVTMWGRLWLRDLFKSALHTVSEYSHICDFNVRLGLRWRVYPCMWQRAIMWGHNQSGGGLTEARLEFNQS